MLYTYIYYCVVEELSARPTSPMPFSVDTRPPSRR